MIETDALLIKSTDTRINANVEGETDESNGKEGFDLGGNYDFTGTIEVCRLREERDSALVMMQDYKDQLTTFTEALSLLDKLVNHAVNTYSKNDIDTKNVEQDILESINALHSKWQLETTPIPSLCHAIHRLQSNLRMVSVEADTSINDNQRFLHLISVEKKKSKKMEKIAKKLLSQNVELKKKLEKKKKQRQSVVESFKDYISTIQVQKQKLDIALVQFHEDQLKEKNKINSTCTTLSLDESDSIMDDKSFVQSCSTVSVTSSSSIVTASGSATVQLLLDENLEWTSSFGKESSSHESNMSITSNERLENQLVSNKINEQKTYKLKFESGKKIGLQFQKVPNNSTDHLIRSKHSNVSSNNSDFDGNITDALLPLSQPSSHSTNTYEENVVDRVPPSKIIADGIFVVCGFEGFDTNINLRPEIGAKLVAVDDESLETMQKSLSFEELRGLIQSKSTPDGTDSFFTMTFREDVLNEDQKIILSRAVAAVACDAKSRNKISSKNCICERKKSTGYSSALKEMQRENIGKENRSSNPIIQQRENHKQKAKKSCVQTLSTSNGSNLRQNNVCKKEDHCPSQSASKLKLDSMTSRFRLFF